MWWLARMWSVLRKHQVGSSQCLEALLPDRNTDQHALAAMAKPCFHTKAACWPIAAQPTCAPPPPWRRQGNSHAGLQLRADPHASGQLPATAAPLLLAGASAGLAFAIPSNTARRVVQQLIQYGAVQRASLGIQPAPDPIARAFNISEGVLIQTADPKGPAVQAGLLATRRGLGGVVAGGCWQRRADLQAKAISRLRRGCMFQCFSFAGTSCCLVCLGSPHADTNRQPREFGFGDALANLLAWCAGFAGDVIVAVDGSPVRNLFDLTSILDERSVGDTVEIKALRGVDQAAAEAVVVRATLEAEQQ